MFCFGDGGAVVGKQEYINKISMSRDHGRTDKYVHEFLGWNERLDSLQANILNHMNNSFGINGICCVDTSPVLDKAWAQRAGIGWIGKHTNLITREFGSWVFLGELIVDSELEYDEPFKQDLCGTCHACIDACPTDAIIADYQMDATKCISYQTIENRENIPEEFSEKMDNWIYE